jgi:uncharacterized glyoxalase superfamily protein PhnB
MSAPRFDQINVVVADPRAAVDFLTTLGLSIDATMPEWEGHHRNLPVASEFEAELDSSAFARNWGALPDGFAGVVVNLRVDERDEVDALYARALDAGAQGLRPPYDAFWGSRFATVMAPGPLAVAVISPRDPSRMEMPPDPGAFA